MAGLCWYQSFRRCHPAITCRQAEGLACARAKQTNHEVIEIFFEKLTSLFAKLNLTSRPDCIYNADETGISCVHKPAKVLAKKGSRSVWSLTSGERGRTHAVLACGSASGIVIPPMVIFPCVRLSQNMMTGAPPGTLFASSPKGWIDSDLFQKWFDHFTTHIPPARPILLIYDGHNSHISVALIEKAMSQDIHILVFPSHTTHLLQPLDVAVFKSLKVAFRRGCETFMKTNGPTRPITKHDICSILGQSWSQSVTPGNLIKGFESTGIMPLNCEKVLEKLPSPSPFLCSSPSTHRPSSTTARCSHCGAAKRISTLLSLPKFTATKGSSTVRPTYTTAGA